MMCTLKVEIAFFSRIVEKEEDGGEKMIIKEVFKNVAEEIIELRRDFHKHPELSFQENRTSKIVADYLRNCGLQVQENVNGYGVVADLKGAEKGPTIAFRADMDALPIQEETDLPFASVVSGVMHACGHDGHTSILMGAAKLLSLQKEKLSGNVRFIFQPAEEVNPGGAYGMIQEGVLNGVEAIFGLHLWSELLSGTFRTCYGPMMAATDRFRIEINGKGGHGGMPHKTIDSIVLASQLVISSQQIISRSIDPLESGVDIRQWKTTRGKPILCWTWPKRCSDVKIQG